MRIANKSEIENFKRKYCRNDYARISMVNDFFVRVESFEELPPKKYISSYATGNRDIENAFIMFIVLDLENQIQYLPVFSESVGRKMLKAWNMPVPRKRSIFVKENKDTRGGNGGNCGNTSNIDNVKMRNLILFVRSLMILHVKEPYPMNGILKEFYEELESNPDGKVEVYKIKSINTALGRFLQSSTNMKNENFLNLQDYIKYLEENADERRLKNTNFDSLRKLMLVKYPNERIYF